MKPWLKLALATCALTLALTSTPAYALPGRCDWRCIHPGTCYDECQRPDNLEWTTCFEYNGGTCDIGA
jgi:hypothetical protein